MFLIKSNYWLSIWWWTSEIKENKHRNIIRFIYLAHFISNLYSISVFKDSRKVRKFTVTQLYWRRDAIRWGKKYWQECENTEKRSKNRFHMSWEQRSAIRWLEIWTDTLWKSQDDTQSNDYSTQQHDHKIKNMYTMTRSLNESKAQLQSSCANENHDSHKNATLVI